ncbi:hypothetical protein RvY_11684 [Ramazzottius varieornatus]|uniref:Uncharacterized protein n=1 Tax=Ramazzottius varieornatus TaxID=947166 RepID=A0A1D1VQR3_RAMVA|nr:hypothetical protein RvY_11684 [Ramazzottius varieornatus]
MEIPCTITPFQHRSRGAQALDDAISKLYGIKSQPSVDAQDPRLASNSMVRVAMTGQA